MKPIGCIIYVCVSILHAQRMSNIFSLIVPLYYIGCLLFTHNTQNTQNPPPPSQIHQRLYELYLWRTSLENLQILRFSLYTHFSSRIHLRWFFINGISIFRHYFLWPWQIHLIKPWHYWHEHLYIKYVGKLDDCKEKIKAASTYNDLIFYKLTVKISRSLKLLLSAFFSFEY